MLMGNQKGLESNDVGVNKQETWKTTRESEERQMVDASGRRKKKRSAD